MKKASLLYFIMIVVAATGAAGQTSMISSTYEMLMFMNSDHDYLENQRERYSHIEGSVYADDGFQEGSIFFMQKKYVGLQLRYNLYDGTFEYNTDQGIKYFDPKATPVDTVWIAAKIYPYVLYQSGNSRKMTYMELALRSPTSVYKLRQVKLISAEPAKGYEEARPARFHHRPDRIFVQTTGNPAMEFSGKKSIAEVFPDNHKELTSYAKTNRLKLKNVADVVILCNYYESIR